MSSSACDSACPKTLCVRARGQGSHRLLGSLRMHGAVQRDVPKNSFAKERTGLVPPFSQCSPLVCREKVEDKAGDLCPGILSQEKSVEG